MLPSSGFSSIRAALSVHISMAASGYGCSKRTFRESRMREACDE